VPRPGRITIELLPPIGGGGETPEALRDAARAQILSRLGEPDLAPKTGATSRLPETAEAE
jgi:hypothetical protein